MKRQELESLIQEQVKDLLEKKRKKKKKKKKKKKSTGKKDACYYKVKSRYSVWPSAYASGALVKCRKVGAKNWGNSTKEGLELQESPEQEAEDAILKTLDKEGGAAGLEPLEKSIENIKLPDDFDIEKFIEDIKTVVQHEEGDYVEKTGLKKKD